MDTSLAEPGGCDASARLAAWAQAFESRLQDLVQQLDPSWQASLAPELAMLDHLPDDVSRRRFITRWLRHRCRGWPQLHRWLEPSPRLVLLRRGPMLRQLCTLALARRPGVLRCVVERRARQALKEALGPNHEPLRLLSVSGRAAPDGVAEWSPLHWACVGYDDWVDMLRAEDRPVRRIVRLSLPQKRPDAPLLRRGVLAERSVPQALQALHEHEVAWPC